MKSIIHTIVSISAVFMLLFSTACEFGSDKKSRFKKLLPLLFLANQKSNEPIPPDPEHTANTCSCGLKSSGGSSLSIAQGSDSNDIPRYSDIKELKYVPDEVIVKFKSGINEGRANSVMRSMGLSKFSNIYISKKIQSAPMKRVKILDNKTVEEAVLEYSNNPDVEFAQPNYIYRSLLMPTDPEFSNQWGLHSSTYNGDINAPEAWNITTDCSSVIVAVLDSGVNYNHRDLENNMWNGAGKHGYDYVDNDDDPMDFNGHGTHVAGIIGGQGNDGIGLTGVCWKVQIMAVRVMDAVGSGDTAKIVSGINYAIDHGAHIINASFGLYAYKGLGDQSMRAAIDTARQNNVLFVAAAGNDGMNLDSSSIQMFPACYTLDNIISVAAIDKYGSIADFSNYGSTSVDIGAPGVNILSTWPGQHVTTKNNFSGWHLEEGWGTGTYTYYSSSGTIDFFMLTNPLRFYYDLYENNLYSTAWNTFDLTIYDPSAATLSFYLDIDIEKDKDNLYVDYSNGSIPYKHLADFSGNSGGLASIEVDLTPIKTSNTSLGFAFKTNDTIKDWGVGITNFRINRLYPNKTACTYQSGTSMAAPYVTGVAALLKARKPTATYIEIKNAILSGGTNSNSLSGITVSGKRLNAKGALDQI